MRTRGGIWPVFGAIILVAAMIQGAWAEDVEMNGDVKVSGGITYATPQTRRWSINGESFIPRSSSTTYLNADGFLSPTTADTVFNAPLHLPDGAVVTGMKAVYRDSGSYRFHIWLYRFNMMQYGERMASFTTAVTGAAYGSSTTASINLATIDNNTYAYLVYVSSMDGTSNHKLGGVVVEYTIDKPLP